MINQPCSNGSLPIAFSMGDPNGIGPEVLLKSLNHILQETTVSPVIAGDAHYLRGVYESLDLSFPFESLEIAEVCAAPYPPRWGTVEKRAGRVAGESLKRAVAICRERSYPLLVTPPVCKAALHLAGFTFPGQTEFVASFFPGCTPCMAFFSDRFHVVLATVHIPFQRILENLTVEVLLQKADLFIKALLLLCSKPPRVAVAGLNPHASEGGLFGSEEAVVLEPAVEELRQRFPQAEVSGPYPPDTVFLRALRGEFDGVVSLYHDQALIPLKLVAFDSAVNTTLGLPITRTSPDHGTAFEIAGQGKADPESMIAAIRWGLRLAYPGRFSGDD